MERADPGCLRIAGDEQPGERPSGPHERHTFVEMCCCLAGEAEIWAGGKVHRLREGGTLIVAPGTLHSAAGTHWYTERPAGRFSRLLWISSFPYGGVLNACESSGGAHRCTPRRLLVERHVNNAVQDALLELGRGDEHCLLMAKCRLLEALAWLCRGEEPDCPEGSFRSMCPPEPEHRDPFSLPGRAMAYIRKNFDGGITLDGIARALYSNKSHLCREFKTSTSLTVGEYLTRVRVEEARRLLVTGLPVSRVSQMVGFEDPYYFSRVFRRATGTSPSAFRAAQRPADMR